MSARPANHADPDDAEEQLQELKEAFLDAFTPAKVAERVASKECTEEMKSADQEKIDEGLKLVTEYDYRRFMRARKWNHQAALKMMVKWLYWGITPFTDGTGRTPFNCIGADANEALYKEHAPHANHGFDVDGRPVYWEKTGIIAPKVQELLKVLSPDDLVFRHIRQQEMALRRCQFVTEKRDNYVDSQVIVFDMEHIPFSIDTEGLKVFRRCLNIDQDFYPERLGALFMINTPWLFQPIWSMVRLWIDPVTVAKFHLIGHDFLGELSKNVPLDQIPEEYGGEATNVPWCAPFLEESGCSPQQLGFE